MPREGMTVSARLAGVPVRRSASAWEQGVVAADELRVGGVKVVGGRAAAIAGPTGGTTIDAEARAAIASILNRLQVHGLIAT